jgi:hypothetical protein
VDQDPGSSAFLTPRSGIRNRFVPDPGSQTKKPKKLVLPLSFVAVFGSGNSEQCCGFGKFIPDPDFYPSRIPDPKPAAKERGKTSIFVKRYHFL